jgi:hypothetical protein
LIFSEALAMVGVSVTPSVGSTSTASRGSRASTAARAASRSPSSAIPRAARKASGSGVSSNVGRRSAIAWSRGASLVSALSPIRGMEAWPARPLVASVKRKTPFSATPTW